MALTKHQKLARGMKHLTEVLEIHCRKTASMLDVLQFHFFETHLIIGRPLMSEKTLGTIMRMHRCTMGLLSPNKELRLAAEHSPLIGCVFTPLFYLQSRVLVLPDDAVKNEKLAIPWGVKTVLPSESFQKLEDAKLEALLYCPSEDEMSEWIDWFEGEDKAASFTNQLLRAEMEFQEKATFENNIRRHAMPFFLDSVAEYYRTSKGKRVSKTILKSDFAPQEKHSIETAYHLVSNSLIKHKKRHLEDFQRFWRDRLVILMFEGMTGTEEHRSAIFAKHFSLDYRVPKTNSGSRWETSSALDRQTYGAFILYFSNRFISNPLKYQVDGEIALLLWIMIYAARDLERPASIKQFLALTTASISDRYATINGGEVEFSRGLTELIKIYTGESGFQRQQKLFPNLTIDKLEDHFHLASKSILLAGAVSALPEAFLTFPHFKKHHRMNSKSRRRELKNPPKIFYDPISLKELKRQLIEKSKLHQS